MNGSTFCNFVGDCFNHDRTQKIFKIKLTEDSKNVDFGFGLKDYDSEDDKNFSYYALSCSGIRVFGKGYSFPSVTKKGTEIETTLDISKGYIQWKVNYQD